MTNQFEHPTIEITDSSNSADLICAFERQMSGKTGIQIVKIARGYRPMALAHGKHIFAIYLDKVVNVIAAITDSRELEAQ